MTLNDLMLVLQVANAMVVMPGLAFALIRYIIKLEVRLTKIETKLDIK